MSDFISKGPSITVSTSDLESKIDAATGKFVKNLSKSQKALGLTIDEMGRYINAQGKCVEGLSQAQIKLGYYVDEIGAVHTANGGFVADLNKIEQALGFYADKLGDVYNAQGIHVRKTAEALKAEAENTALEEKAAKAKIEAEQKIQKELEKTAQKENELKEERQRQVQIIGNAFGAVSQLTGQFASLLSSVECTDDAVGGFRSTLIQVAEIA